MTLPVLLAHVAARWAVTRTPTCGWVPDESETEMNETTTINPGQPTEVTIRDTSTGEELTTWATLKIATSAYEPTQVVIEGNFWEADRRLRPSERAALEAVHRESAIRDRIEDDVDVVALRALLATHPLTFVNYEPRCPRCSTAVRRESWPCGRVRALETYLGATGAGQ